MTSTDTPSADTFAAFVRERVLNCINAPATDGVRAPVDDLARAFLNSFNEFLIREGQAPISLDSIADIPSDLAQQLAVKLETWSFRYEKTPFTHGSDVARRVNSRDSNKSLADLIRATSRYFSAATHEPPCAEPHFKLWKRVVSQNADGTTQATMKEVDRIDTTEHAIIGLNGIWGMHSFPDRTRGLINQIDELVSGGNSHLTQAKGRPIGIYAVSYPDRNRIHYAAEVPASNADPEGYVSEPARDFVERIIIPSLGLHDPNITPSLTDIKSALRKLNFLNYSSGSTVCREIRNVLAEKLMARGFNEAEVERCLAEVYALYIHPVCRLDDNHPCGNFSSIYQVSKNDLVSFSRADYQQYVPADAKLPYLAPIGKNGLLIWDDTPIYLGSQQTIQANAATTKEQLVYSAQAADMLPHTAGLTRSANEGHWLWLSTQHYPYKDKDNTGHDVTKFHDPSHVKFTLRNAVTMDTLPADLSRTFEPISLIPPPPDPELASPMRLKLSETMKQAIRRFHDRLREREKG